MTSSRLSLVDLTKLDPRVQVNAELEIGIKHRGRICAAPLRRSGGCDVMPCPRVARSSTPFAAPGTCESQGVVGFRGSVSRQR